MGLHQRSQSGRGTWADVSMVHTSLSWLTPYLVSHWNNRTPAPYPPDDPGYGLFRTRDGEMAAISISREDPMWRRLCEILRLDKIEKVEWPERRQRRDELTELLRNAIARHSISELEKLFDGTGVPFQRVNTWDDVLSESRFPERRMHVNDEYGRTYLRQPLAFPASRWSGQANLRVPRLGEDATPVLTRLGYTQNEISDLFRDRILHTYEREKPP
jgi:crotonobetainyl-CoA:carnitine CoA-transferase CaiB-like acyl-CoA transferase